MSYRIAGIDVHKKMLAVAVADVEVDGDSAPRLAGTLHLALAQSNRGPGGRKRDFPDAERW